MKKVSLFVINFCLAGLVSVSANAAGTYYTNGAYQSPQTPYGQSAYSTQRTGTTYSANRYPTYSGTRNVLGTNVTTTTKQTKQTTTNTTTKNQKGGKNGFWVDAGFSREVAQWQFEMKQSGSLLHYDNIDWNVLDINAGYGFNVGKTAMEVTAGFKYGFQSGESSMVDDDITNGGYLASLFCESVDENGNCNGSKDPILESVGHALSVGKSDGGDMMGFNIGVGLTDIFKWGNVRFTPSIGYRYLKYKLETKSNYGMVVDTAACFEVNGEIQCDPIILFYDSKGDVITTNLERENIDEYLSVPSDAQHVGTQGTYYFQQPGVSHSYEVEWSGPYIAMDMDYLINQNNSVNARVELGFPGYTSTGDQPYRFDWAHPKSVEDEASMFSAFHLGLGANWVTAITDSISLSVGVTYDYYTVSDADAKTYLNQSYYTSMYDELLKEWNDKNGESGEAGMLNPKTGDGRAIAIKQLESECPGWVCSIDSEIESFYKSLGVRVGINAKF